MGGIVTPIALRGLKVDRQHELGEAVEITLAHDVAGGLNVAHETFSMNAISNCSPSAHRIGYLDPAAFERNVELLLTGDAEKPELKQRPQGAWTHNMWNAVLARRQRDVQPMSSTGDIGNEVRSSVSDPAFYPRAGC
jgi:hypothetical protein